jgi:hypothetical protein
MEVNNLENKYGLGTKRTEKTFKENDFSGRLEQIRSTFLEMGNISELLSDDGSKIAELTAIFQKELEARKELIFKCLKAGNPKEADVHMDELEHKAKEVREIIAKAMELTIQYLKLQSEFRMGLRTPK